jgi:hypothetical protein
MSNELNNIDGSADLGVNWSGRFRVSVNGLDVIGVTAFACNLIVNEGDVLDAGEPMPIGKTLDSRQIVYTIAIKNLSGGNSSVPEVKLPGNVQLFEAALGHRQFTLSVIERNLKKNRSDWLLRSILLQGATVRGNVQLVNFNERGGGPPVVPLTGTALSATVKLGTKTYVYTGLG